GLVVAVDDAGHAAGAALGPGGTLAGPRTRRRIHLSNRRHDNKSSTIIPLRPPSPCVCRNGKGRSCGHSWRRLITGADANDKETAWSRSRAQALLLPARGERCYGAGDEGMAPSLLQSQLMERPMKRNDLSRSLVAFDQNS